MLACAAYAVFLAVMLAELAVQMKFDSAKGMVIILTVWSLYLFFAEFYVICIQKRNSLPPGTYTFYLQCACGLKGRADPWSLDELSEQCGVLSDIYIAGITVFDVSLWRILLFAGICICNLALEISLMVCLYSSERISEKAREWIGRGIKVFLLMVTGLIVLYFWKKRCIFCNSFCIF